MSLLIYSAKSLKEICFGYIKKPCSKNEIYNWTECSLFCLPFKIYGQIKANKFYYCTCIPFLCEEKCPDPHDERILYCYKWEIKGNPSGLKGHNQHCIIYNCDTYGFEDNIKQIWKELNENEDKVLKIYYTLNKFFTLLFCYKEFGQPNKEKYDPAYDFLNFKLPGVAFCKFWTSLRWKI